MGAKVSKSQQSPKQPIPLSEPVNAWGNPSKTTTLPRLQPAKATLDSQQHGQQVMLQSAQSINGPAFEAELESATRTIQPTSTLVPSQESTEPKPLAHTLHTLKKSMDGIHPNKNNMDDVIIVDEGSLGHISCNSDFNQQVDDVFAR